MEKMTCPICGKDFDANEYVIGENGNPICPECAEKEGKGNINTVSNEK